MQRRTQQQHGLQTWLTGLLYPAYEGLIKGVLPTDGSSDICEIEVCLPPDTDIGHAAIRDGQSKAATPAEVHIGHTALCDKRG